MNVLIIVMTFLMVLTLMTYAKLEHFRDRNAIRELFRKEMEMQERRFAIDTAKARYDETPVDTSKKGDIETENKSKEKASSRLSLYIFTNKEAQEKQGDLMEPIKQILKNLIKSLYGENPLFAKKIEGSPEFIDTLVDTLIDHVKKGQEGVALSSGKDLANFDLNDQTLNDITYHMLKGKPVPEGEEDRAKEGYLPLSNFITFKNTEKIRVYLAPKELLEQLFDPGGEVPYIIKSREDLYNQVKNKRMEEKDASKAFESLFRGKQRPYVPDALLDYTVTKSNPKDYS